jgi:hypothetical protein
MRHGAKLQESLEDKVQFDTWAISTEAANHLVLGWRVISDPFAEDNPVVAPMIAE